MSLTIGLVRGRAGVLEDRPDGRCGDSDAEPGEFAVDAPVSPRRVLSRETDDRAAGFDCGGWPAGPVRVGPVVRDESPMPTQQCVGLDHEDRPAVTAERTRERGEDRAIVGFETRTPVLALENGELVTQHKDFDVFGTIRATGQHEQV
jgi:hypothetical protein